MTHLAREDILDALRSLDKKARKDGVSVEIAIYGGAAIALGFDSRRSTRDVDVVIRGGVDFIRRAAREIADERGWPEDWLNDGVKGFVSGDEKLHAINLPEKDVNEPYGLTVYTPTVISHSSLY